ncbi:MAG TPA: hypothetical protein VFQ06_13680, partial [Nitrospira sp.]|nr:hypothetical protein [Nitrospira sp.]
ELLEEASTMMVATGASVLIVTKENQPVGVLSAQDLMLTPPRRPINIPTVVTVVDEATPQRQAHNANIVQLSHVSARLESASSLHPKTRVVLAFSLPGQHTPLTIHGKVLSSETLPTTAAQESSEQTVAVEIQFADLSTTDLTRLKAWTLQAIPSPLDRP